jgi:hypothetical protein
MNQSKRGKASPKTSKPKSNQNKRNTPNAQKKAGVAKQKGPRKSGPSLGKLTRQYIETLADPFEHSGVPLGFGALVQTRISTLYLRGNTAANADGTLALLVYPQTAGLLSIANGGSAVSFATSAAVSNATDYTAILASAGAGRVISAGIKAYPNLAATASPGQCAVGSIPGSTFALSQALTPADLIVFPTSHIGKGYEGGVACGRPQDTDSFSFYPQMVNATGFLTTTPLPCSIPYVSFSGIGNATTVFYEVVVNIEYVESLQHNAAPIGMGGTTNVATLASEWTNLETMWSYVKGILPDPGRTGYNSLSGIGSVTSSVMNTGGDMTFGGQLRRNLRN